VKTLHLTNSWHASSGGIATFYRSLMQAANARGHALSLVVPGKEDSIEHAGLHATIYQVRSKPSPVNRQYRMISPFAYLARGSRLRQILQAELPDLIEVCDKYTLNYFAAMLRAGMMGDVECRPMVVGLSCERMDDNVRAYLGWNRLAPHLVRFYMKWIYFSFFDQHVANSHYTAQELESVSHGHPIRRGVWVRPMGVDCRGLSPTHRSSLARHYLLERLGAGRKAMLLLYVGRLVPEKNLALLLETLSSLQSRQGRDWRLILVGDGMERQPFLAEAARRGVGHLISWLGHIRDREELARIYANCDIFLHPNPREPFGIAPLEAMASGLPLVAPNCGGILSYADLSNAWIVPPAGEAFAEAVREAIANHNLRERRVANALLTAEKFLWENVANSFLDLYEDLLRPQRGEPSLFPADFFSTPPETGKAAIAGGVAAVLQRLLATRSGPQRVTPASWPHLWRSK